MVVVIVVLLAAVLHATWNALTHAITDKVVGITLMSSAFVALGAVMIPFVGLPAPSSWPFLLVSVVVQALYVISLMRSYRLGAFNQVYPIARGMSPWVVALFAAVFLHEALSAWQIVGVVVVSAGLGSLIFAKGRPHTEEIPAILAAVLTGLLIATYTLIDGVGVRHTTEPDGSSSPMAYAAWLFLLHGLTLVGYGCANRGRKLLGELRQHWKLGLTAGTLSVLAYGLVLWAQSRGSLATVAALRETSVIVGAIIGALAFKEPFGRWRTVSTVVVAAGIAMMNLAG